MSQNTTIDRRAIKKQKQGAVQTVTRVLRRKPQLEEQYKNMTGSSTNCH
jgi:hypothetical protein